MSVERGVSYRERAAGCYSVLPFSLALARILPNLLMPHQD